MVKKTQEDNKKSIQINKQQETKYNHNIGLQTKVIGIGQWLSYSILLTSRGLLRLTEIDMWNWSKHEY